MWICPYYRSGTLNDTHRLLSPSIYQNYYGVRGRELSITIVPIRYQYRLCITWKLCSLYDSLSLPPAFPDCGQHYYESIRTFPHCGDSCRTNVSTSVPGSVPLGATAVLVGADSHTPRNLLCCLLPVVGSFSGGFRHTRDENHPQGSRPQGVPHLEDANG